MGYEIYRNNSLWPILVATIYSMPMFPHHKANTRDVLPHEHPGLSARELAEVLGITLGEALVILYDLAEKQ